MNLTPGLCEPVAPGMGVALHSCMKTANQTGLRYVCLLSVCKPWYNEFNPWVI